MGSLRDGLRSTLLVLSAALSLLALGPSTTYGGDRVVLVSWDGVRRDVLKELLEWQPVDETPNVCPYARHAPVMPTECNGYLTCLPTLCNFQIIDSLVVEGKPLTRPQHAQLLSGYGPSETGDITNAGRRSLPMGMSIYERIFAERPEIFTVHIAGRKYVGRGVIRWARASGALKLDMKRGGRDRYSGRNTTERAVDALDVVGTSPFFMFVHFKATDVLGHRVGDGRKQYREAIIQNDVQLGALLQALMDRGLMPTTEVYVTTDHGFHGIFHVNGEDPLIADTWFASLRHNLAASISNMLDVTPTILRQLDVPLESADPPYRGRSLLP